ncbi:TadE/TadG family type IV pilus assembly protein [Sphingomonas mollis]|uniref:TadE/TadG family type IV pilus assembly protein n=1 Tax=Sphingomonas mollis TaxID=2795726 RepID=UPI0022B8CF4E|nr:TadE/TadG family type IV pilus assembly protein [Sphingomonas sp. BT553]
MGLFSRIARKGGATTFLGRLVRDVRGNTLAIMAAAIIPLAGMVGSGLDMSRMYITKTRLQHACDAGALAGRRAMGGGAWDSADDAQAKNFFKANFVTGAYGTQSLDYRYSENAGKVSGTASAVVPMTLMKVLGINTQTLSVACNAEMKLPNSDVMFVLDTTGSMNCVAGNANCTNNNGVPAAGSKIDGLKIAVKCFYQIVAQLDITDTTCPSGEPTGGTGGQVQVRFGFMPYSSNVNVGKLLPSSYFANSWNYQSRTRNGNNTAWSDYQTAYTRSSRDANCPNYITSTEEYRNGSKVRDGSTYYCQYDYRFNGPEWRYESTSINYSALKNGEGWNASFTLPINDDGSQKTISWDGCIEERPTVRTTDYDPIPNSPPSNKAWDLDIDLVPTSSETKSLWYPALPQVIFYRNVLTNLNQATDNTRTISANRYYNGSGAACPTEARKLQVWSNSDTFKDYVNGLEASGNTYHDIGILWGARFMSPDGIFKASNAKTPAGGTIQRHMIFMTDGDSTSNPCDYNAYGVPFWDKRQTTSVGNAADCGKNSDDLIDQINLRLEALCTAVKNKGITLWVVSYGGGLSSDTEKRLAACSSPADATTATHYFAPKQPSDLSVAFAAIANNISQLRITG